MQRECVPWKPVLLGRGGERQAQAEENGSRVNEHSHAVMAALGPAAVTQADDECHIEWAQVMPNSVSPTQ